MKQATLHNAIYFLQRVVPRGEEETDALVATVQQLQTELAKRQNKSNPANKPE